MSSLPLVSVCIPTFNHVRFLPDALASAQAQTYPNLEIVVTDNQSTDGTAEWIATAARADGRIRHVRHPENLGMARNFSSCISEARGDYVKLLCDDDRLAPECVARLVAMIEADPGVSIAGCARQFSDEHWRPVKVLGAGRDRPVTVPGGAMRRECFVWGNRVGEPTAVLFRRRDAQRGFHPDYGQLVDLEMWMHLLERGSFAYTPEALCTVRLHGEQGTAANLRSGRVVEDKRRLFRDFVPQIGDSLSWRDRWLWDARFALSAGRVRRAGGTVSDLRDEAVFHPVAYRAFTAPAVNAAMTALRM